MNRLPRTVQKISAGATSALKNAGRSCEMTGLDAFLDFSGFDAGVYESTLSASGIRDAAQISLASICLDQLVSEFYGVQTQSGSLLVRLPVDLPIKTICVILCDVVLHYRICCLNLTPVKSARGSIRWQHLLVAYPRVALTTYITPHRARQMS